MGLGWSGIELENGSCSSQISPDFELGFRSKTAAAAAYDSSATATASGGDAATPVGFRRGSGEERRGETENRRQGFEEEGFRSG